MSGLSRVACTCFVSFNIINLDLFCVCYRYISPCCVSRYLEYEEKEKEEERIEIALRGHELEDTREAVRRGCWNSLRHRIFLFLEYPRSSPAATVRAVELKVEIASIYAILRPN